MQTRFSEIFFLSCCLLFLCKFSCSKNTDVEYKHRTKRKAVFSKSSKLFFRLNGKDNILNHTEIFAHGWSFRINYDLPETVAKRHQFFKRDVHAELETITDGYNSKIYSCVLKYVCEIVAKLDLAENCGIFCGIGNIIAASEGMEANFFKSFTKKCDFHVKGCPYSFKDAYISSYG